MPSIGMDDYSALAYRIAGSVADVRGCLILSRDGLILGSYPDDETAVKPAWMRFASLGDPERSFVEFGDQVWVYVRRPTYVAFAVAEAGVRPGLVIDQLEQILLAAEEARSRRETLRLPEAIAAPSGKPRTSLHPSIDRSEAAAQSPPATAQPPAAGAPESRPWARADASLLRLRPGRSDPDLSEIAELTAARAEDEPSSKEEAPSEQERPEDRNGADEPRREDEPREEGEPVQLELDAEAEVDRVLLAKEFSGLLQVERGDDEASS